MTVDVSFPNTTSSAAGMSTVESDAMVIRSPASLYGLLSSSSRVLWYYVQSKSEVGDDVALGTMTMGDHGSVVQWCIVIVIVIVIVMLSGCGCRDG